MNMPEIKPRIVVSRCLGFAPCRYNNQEIKDAFVARLAQHAELITLCPEEDIGLGTPRDPVRLVEIDRKVHMIQPASGNDVTETMQAYITATLGALDDIDAFLLKSRSPSCGPFQVKIYASHQKGSSAIKGVGMLPFRVRQRFPFAAIEDEGRLSNFHIREAFLMRIFALARLRGLLASPSAAAISTFHARHKLLLMCYHQEWMRRLGRIAANPELLPAPQLAAQYAQAFREAINRAPNQRNIINALYHGFGWVSEGLSPSEKRLFINAIEEYRDDRVTLATLQHLLKSYVARFEHAYLGSQYLLEPYPKALFDLSDSGRQGMGAKRPT